MAKVTGVGRDKGGYHPEGGPPISEELANNRDRTMTVAKKVSLITNAADFSATLGAIGDPSKALSAAKRNMLTFRLY